MQISESIFSNVQLLIQTKKKIASNFIYWACIQSNATKTLQKMAIISCKIHPKIQTAKKYYEDMFRQMRPDLIFNQTISQYDVRNIFKDISLVNNSQAIPQYFFGKLIQYYITSRNILEDRKIKVTPKELAFIYKSCLIIMNSSYNAKRYPFICPSYFIKSEQSKSEYKRQTGRTPFKDKIYIALKYLQNAGLIKRTSMSDQNKKIVDMLQVGINNPFNIKNVDFISIKSTKQGHNSLINQILSLRQV